SSALFDRAVALGADPVGAANWITQDVAALRNAGGGDGALTAEHVADVVALVATGAVSNAGAKQALEASFTSGEAVEAAVDRLGLVRAFQGVITHPLQRMWRSGDPIDAYGLNHLTSVAGDALLAISLSDSIFFSVPVGQARLRVTAYLLLTMLPLALAGPLMAP